MKPKNLLYFILFIGCTFTTTKTIEPKFRDGIESMQPRLEALLTCEHINVTGIQITVDGKTDRKLEISILNPVDLPQNNNDLKKLARSVAREFKNQLVNRGEFNIFKIFFIKQTGNEKIKSNSYKEVTLEYDEL